jgi:4-hydroxy-tetrahydrodipicolinate reductase
MNASTRILLVGASGRMGRQLLRVIGADPRCELLAIATGTGKGAGHAGLAVLSPTDLAQAPEVDVVIDFSRPAGFEASLEFCLRCGCALVSGTTGLDDLHWAAMDAAAQRIPLLWAANFSLGIALMDELVRRSAMVLQGWDCDIVESHHARKLDAPSGTALQLARSIEAERGEMPAMHSLRAGDIVGEHTVQFTGLGERLELTHRATDRAIFARGALEAAVRLSVQGPGRYRISELMF